MLLLKTRTQNRIKDVGVSLERLKMNFLEESRPEVEKVNSGYFH